MSPPLREGLGFVPAIVTGIHGYVYGLNIEVFLDPLFQRWLILHQVSFRVVTDSILYEWMCCSGGYMGWISVAEMVDCGGTGMFGFDVECGAVARVMIPINLLRHICLIIATSCHFFVVIYHYHYLCYF